MVQNLFDFFSFIQGGSVSRIKPERDTKNERIYRGEPKLASQSTPLKGHAQGLIIMHEYPVVGAGPSVLWIVVARTCPLGVLKF